MALGSAASTNPGEQGVRHLLHHEAWCQEFGITRCQTLEQHDRRGGDSMCYR